MSEKASIKVEWSTFDFDKDEEEKKCPILISGEGKLRAEQCFLLRV